MSDDASNDLSRTARALRQRMQAAARAGVRRIARPAPPDPLPDPEPMPVEESSTADAVPVPPARPAPKAQTKTKLPRLEVVESVDLFDAMSGPELSTEEKAKALEEIAEEVRSCQKCPDLAEARHKAVPGEGSPDAKIVLVGEAPGADEDRQGRPFIGRAGQLLTKIIEACQLKREDVFICNILKCRPPGNRNPLPDEVAHCIGYLHRQLEVIRPKFIVALGSVAAQCLLDSKESIGRMRGKLFDYRGVKLMATYHPAYLLRSPGEKRKVWDDMRKLMLEFDVEL